MLFSFVLKDNLKQLIPILSSNSRSLDFELKALFIIVNKKIITIDKAINISNTTPLSQDENINLAQGGRTYNHRSHPTTIFYIILELYHKHRYRIYR